MIFGIPAVLAAQTGAMLAELMGQLGHSTSQAAMRYQHAPANRDAIIARRLSEMISPCLLRSSDVPRPSSAQREGGLNLRESLGIGY